MAWTLISGEPRDAQIGFFCQTGLVRVNKSQNGFEVKTGFQEKIIKPLGTDSDWFETGFDEIRLKKKNYFFVSFSYFIELAFSVRINETIMVD